MTLLLLSAWILFFDAMALACLTLERHRRDVLADRQAGPSKTILTASAWALGVFATVLLVREQGGVGLVWTLGLLTVAGLLVTLLLTYRPRRVLWGLRLSPGFLLITLVLAWRL